MTPKIPQLICCNEFIFYIFNICTAGFIAIQVNIHKFCQLHELARHTIPNAAVAVIVATTQTTNLTNHVT